ncbi:MAG TPA: hypothetical protein VGQ83_25650 [Polyangia bacterium]
MLAAGLAVGAALGVAACGGARWERPRSCAAVESGNPWQDLLEKWEIASAAAEGGGALDPAEKAGALAAITAALGGLDRMSQRGGLTAEEAHSLQRRLLSMRAQLENRPVEELHGDCHLPATLRPPLATVRRVRLRLDTLERITSAHRLRTSVVRAALGSVTCDLEQAERLHPVAGVPPDLRAKVLQERAALRRRLQQLEAASSAPRTDKLP